jgi:hypothetical protein
MACEDALVSEGAWCCAHARNSHPEVLDRHIPGRLRLPPDFSRIALVAMGSAQAPVGRPPNLCHQFTSSTPGCYQKLTYAQEVPGGTVSLGLKTTNLRKLAELTLRFAEEKKSAARPPCI